MTSRSIVAALLLLSVRSFSQTSPAPTPPMGWNSWDSYGTTVREEQVKANADAMARGLASHGWQYIVVDIQWYEPNAQGHDYAPGAKLSMDEYGRLLPAVNRFPSSVDGSGFKHLADYVHGKGLKFGIHIMRGIPRQAVAANLQIKGTRYNAADIADKDNPCQWNLDMWGVDTTKPGAQAYYDSIAELYASWGVDFIKADDMGSHLYQPAEMKALAQAIRNTGRPMVLSISPGPAPLSEAEFDYARDWAEHVGKNATWPDADMLPLGRLRITAKEGGGSPTKFTPDEQQTLMTLWSIFRSPLIFGGDLPSNDGATTALITNDEVLAVDQHSSGNHQSLESGNIRAWIADVPDGKDHYVALFNLEDNSEQVDLPWSKIGIPASSAEVRDLWAKAALGRKNGVQIELRPHASVLYRISTLQ